MIKTIKLGKYIVLNVILFVGVTFAQTVIPLDTSYSGTLSGQTKVFFAVPVESDGNFSVTLTPSNGVNIQLMLNTPEKNEIVRADCWGNPLTLGVNGVKPDTFYISLWGYFGNNESYQFTLTTEFSMAVLENDIEPNDISTDANSFPINSTVTGHIGYDGYWASNPADVIDWWKITTIEDGSLTVNITQVEPVNLQLALYRPDGSSEILRADTWGNTTSLTINNLRDGTYFVRILKYAWNFTPYTLDNTFIAAVGSNDPEPNDLAEDASLLTNGVPTEGHLGYDGFRDELGFDNLDWWYFTLQDTSEIDLILTQTASANLRPQLFKDNDVTLIHNGDDTNGQGYEMHLAQALPGNYYLRLWTYGMLESYSLNLSVLNVTDINKNLEVPTQFELMQNYPNPFNPTTTIKFTVPSATRSTASHYNTKLIVYDMLGRTVKVLVDGVMNAGYHEVSFDGSQLSSGLYFYRISVDEEFSSVRKMMLLK